MDRNWQFEKGFYREGDDIKGPSIEDGRGLSLGEASKLHRNVYLWTRLRIGVAQSIERGIGFACRLDFYLC
jgi:hypothetical protein